jgi:hypothetical protein
LYELLILQLSNNELKGRNVNQISGAWRCLLTRFKEIQAGEWHTSGGDGNEDGTDQTDEQSAKKLQELEAFKDSEAFQMMEHV